MDEYSIPEEVMGQAQLSGYGMDESVVDGMITFVAHAVKPVVDSNLPDPVEYLKEVMKQQGLCNKDLKIYIGSAGNVSSVLNRRKPLTLRMIRNLHKYLGIPAEILIQPYTCH